jgi:hypothetical protein
MGRDRVSACYHQLVATSPHARCLYVVQHNWSIHTHPEVLATVERLPQVTPVWLPTYAISLPQGRTPWCTMWASWVTVDLAPHDGPHDYRF